MATFKLLNGHVANWSNDNWNGALATHEAEWI